MRYKRHLHKVNDQKRDKSPKFCISISYEQNNLISLDGLPLALDSDLANLKYTAIENYDHYKEQYGLNSLFGCNIKIPIFITPREREEHYKIKKKKNLIFSAKLRTLLFKCLTMNLQIVS